MHATDRERFERVRELFIEVCEQPCADRSAVLDRLCNGDAALRAEVESLFEYEDRASSDLDSAAAELESVLLDSLGQSPTRVLPERIGTLLVLALLGEGGMGVVYLAQQDRPRRTVAVKVIRPGFATRELARRLEHEAQVLARLQHPGIAQVFDVGTCDFSGSQQPYVVMEYVRGRPLIEYVHDHSLSTQDRLHLLANICDAVQHAHQRGVIHRDLKPANILVDETGRPKILDFGVARATDPEAAFTTIGTRRDRLVGTLAYMSPEQIDGEDIDTRSDVYALGVIAFEMLTGELPHDLRGLPMAAMLRTLRENPPRALRSMSTTYRGDLETIVGKAMEPEPDRRYQTARELASDIRAFLRGEPIEARRDSMMYVLRKRMRRYRGAVAAAVVGLVALASFTVYAAMQSNLYQSLALSEAAARESAEDARSAAEEASRRAALSQEIAARERDAAQAVTQFLVDMLGLADPNITHSFDASVRDLLAGASAAVGQLFEGLPEAEAEIRGHLGRIYATLGDLDDAELHLRRAVALRDELGANADVEHYELLWPYLHVLLDLNDVLHSTPRLRAERLGRTLLAQTHPDLHDLCRDARHASTRQPLHEVIELINDVVSQVRIQLEPNEPQWLLVADQLHLSGLSHKLNGTGAVAVEFYRPALEMYRRVLPETNSRVARTMGDLIDVLLVEEQFESAEELTLEALDRLHRLLGADHWYIALHEVRLGRASIGLSRVDAARFMLPEAYERLKEARGDSSVFVIDAARAMIELADQHGSPAERKHWRAAYASGLAATVSIPSSEQLRIAIGPDRSDLSDALTALDECLSAITDDCTAPVAAAFDLIRASLDPAEPAAGLVADVLMSWSHRAGTQGHDDYALQLKIAQESARLADANEHRHLRKMASTYWWLSANHERSGEHEAGAFAVRRALEFIHAQHAEHYAFESAAESLLASHLANLGRLDEAWDLIIPAYETMLRHGGPAAVDTAIAFGRAVRIAAMRGRPHDADALIASHFDLLRKRGASDRAMRSDTWRVALVPGLSLWAYRQALELLDNLSEEINAEPMTKLVRAAALYRSGMAEEALPLLRAVEFKKMDRPAHLSFLAMALYQTGNHDEAAAALQTLRAMQSARPSWWTVMHDRYVDEASSAMPDPLAPRNDPE